MASAFQFLHSHQSFFRSEGEKVVYTKGQHIVQKEESSEWVYFLDKGLVKVAFSYTNGLERLLGYFLPGMTFAQLGSFFNEPSSGLEYEALGSAHVYRVPREEFFKELSQNEQFNKDYLNATLMNQMFLIERIAYQGEKGIKTKCIKWLLFMGKYYCDNGSNSCHIMVPITHDIIANFLHATRESIHKAINELQREGYITLKNKQLVITNKERLRAHAESI